MGTIEEWTPTMLLNKIKTHYRNSNNENDIEKLQFWQRKTVPVFSRGLQNIVSELRLYNLKLRYQHSGNRLWIIEKINNNNSTVLPDQSNNLDSMDSTLDNNNINPDDSIHDDFEQGRLE